MNKYQEAFNNIYSSARIDDCYCYFDEHDLEIIEELVEKTTPKKVIKGEETIHIKSRLCPNCGMSVSVDKYSEYHYCSNCGQCINRGKDETL